MQQQYSQTFFHTLARSAVCLALIVPVCDYADADDKLKNSLSTHRTLKITTTNSAAYSSGLRGRKSNDKSGIHRDPGLNKYNEGLKRNKGQQDQRKKDSITRNNNTYKNQGVRQVTGNSITALTSSRIESHRYNRIIGEGGGHRGQSRKKSENTTNVVKPANSSGFVKSNNGTDKKQAGISEYESSQYKRHYDNSRHNNSPDKINLGKREHNKYKSNTYNEHNGYHNYIKKYKKNTVKRHRINRIFFAGYSFVPYSYYAYYYPGLLAYPDLPQSYSRSIYFSGFTYKIENSGWVQLSNGQIIAAMESFSMEMENYPNAGIPKIGYALAIAAIGDLTKAVLAMREALRYDPESLQYIYLDENLLEIVDNLIEKYEYPLQFNNRRPDEAFMVAALYYLEQDYKSAQNALGRAMADDDKSLSVKNLDKIIIAKLQEDYAGNYK